MVAAGADVIELGVPFSDPMADGPVIQRAGERALAHGVGMPQVLDMVARLPRAATTTTPVVLMGYANPVERYDRGMAQAPSSRDARRPASTACWSSTTRPRNARTSPPRCRRAGIDLIFLLAPTSHRRAHASRSAASPAATSTTCRSRA